MIVPMMKYAIVAHHADVDVFLHALQEYGVVDVERQFKPIDDYSKDLMDQADLYLSVFRSLKQQKPGEEVEKLDYDAQKIVEETQQILLEREQLRTFILKLTNDIKDAAPWGEWKEESLDKLQKLDLTPHFYAVSEKQFDVTWTDAYAIQEVGRENGKIYFVVLEQKDEPFAFPLNEVKFPQAPVHILQKELENSRHRLESLNTMLDRMSLSKDLMRKEHDLAKEKLEHYLAGKSTQKEAGNTIAVINAFIPASQSDDFKAFLDTQNVMYLSEKAVAEDNPPVKLQNNRFSCLFEPIGSMFMPPQYYELDLTPYFAPFYMLFFGFCLGDMGYGLLLLVVGTLAKFKFPKMKGILTLVQCLGLGSIIMPALTGTFFGLKLGELFHIEGFFLNDIQLFWFALIFGAFQIIVARVIHTVDTFIRHDWQSAMPHLGWSMALIGTGFYAMKAFTEINIPPILIQILLFGGLALIIFFTSKSKNIFKRVGSGISSLYDITGLFGDLLSYIRLFGLATAGGILGFVVNTVVGMIFGLPYVGYVIGGIVLIVGHIGVLALSALGAFVHPMRLTFVEFYKNAGFIGGGRPYKPFKKTDYDK